MEGSQIWVTVAGTVPHPEGGIGTTSTHLVGLQYLENWCFFCQVGGHDYVICHKTMATHAKPARKSKRKRKPSTIFVSQEFVQRKPSGKRKKRKKKPKTVKVHGNVTGEREIRKKAAERVQPVIDYANKMHKFVINVTIEKACMN